MISENIFFRLIVEFYKESYYSGRLFPNKIRFLVSVKEFCDHYTISTETLFVLKKLQHYHNIAFKKAYFVYKGYTTFI